MSYYGKDRHEPYSAFGNGRHDPTVGVSTYLVSQVVESVSVRRHGRSVLVPSLGLSVEHIHPAPVRRTAIAI